MSSFLSMCKQHKMVNKLEAIKLVFLSSDMTLLFSNKANPLNQYFRTGCWNRNVLFRMLGNRCHVLWIKVV